MKRVVVKVGSSVVTGSTDSGRLEIDRNSLFRIADQICQASASGLQVILVSSGAVAMGLEELDLQSKPGELARVQALAAVGQSQLMRLWHTAFGHHGRHVGQVLLTHQDLDDRTRFLNVRATLDSLLAYGVVPVINENDTVATAEITVGDNDNLASLVAKHMGVDLLVLLSTVDGLLDGEGTVVPRVAAGDDPYDLVTGDTSATGRGGMGSKLDAAAASAASGVSVVIANGKTPGVLAGVLEGQALGTRFEADTRGLTGRKHWIRYVLKPRGTVQLDAGAAAAVLRRGASLLSVGITTVSGDFVAGEAVSIVDPDGIEIARGLARTGATELHERIGTAGGGPAIHRDDLVRMETD
ncbi:MAG: glutamate 5-kinase [Myxococcota bacterium]|jgi:glutamate 5-kinase